MRWLLFLALAGCVTDEAARTSDEDGPVEGLVRQPEPRCGPRREFVLSVMSRPVADRLFSIRKGATPEGPEVARVTTSPEGAFRATLVPGRYCFVDVVAPGACAAVLDHRPKTEPVPVVVLPPEPCAR